MSRRIARTSTVEPLTVRRDRGPSADADERTQVSTIARTPPAAGASPTNPHTVRSSVAVSVFGADSDPDTDTAPADTAPVGTAPVGTAPVGTASVGTAPVGTAPVGTAPVGTASVGTASVSTAPADTASVGTASTYTPEPDTNWPSATKPGPAAPSNDQPVIAGYHHAERPYDSRTTRTVPRGPGPKGPNGLLRPATRPGEVRRRVPQAPRPTDATQAQREAYLRSRSTHLTPEMQDRLEGVVVPAVLALNCRHAETDRHRLSILYYFAAWFWESFGRVLNPKTDLTPGNIQQYCHYRQDVHSSTHNSITLVLTRIRDGDPAKKAPSPTTKQHPAYSDTQRHRLFDDAERIPDERWRREVLTALYLAFDAGARMGEMAALRGTDLHAHSADSLTVRITTERTVRDVPVYDSAARHLRQFIDDPGYVVNPGQARRRSNAIPHLRYAAQRQNPKFGDLDFSAARRNYFINLMARPVPMNIVMYLGDAHATEDMPQALFWYAPRPTPGQVRAAINAART